MKKIVLILTIAAFVICGCEKYNVKKKTAPGQIQKETGYNPASGKVKKK